MMKSWRKSDLMYVGDGGVFSNQDTSQLLPFKQRNVNMRKKLLNILVVLAAPIAFVPQSAMADAYLGLGIGEADYTADNLDTSTAGKAYAGFIFSPDWGVEVGYIDFGEFDVENGRAGNSVETNGGYVALSGFSRINEQFELTGKLGAFFYNQDVNTGAGTRSTDGESVFLGIGAHMYLNPAVALGLEYNHVHDVENEDINAVFLQVHAYLDRFH